MITITRNLNVHDCGFINILCPLAGYGFNYKLYDVLCDIGVYMKSRCYAI